MTNADVVKMVKAGLDDDIVLAAMHAAPTQTFNLSAEALIELKTAGVSSRVMAAMLNNGKTPPQPGTAPAPTSLPTAPSGAANAAPYRMPIPNAVAESRKPRAPGIYVLSNGKLEQLEPTVATSTGVGAGSLMASGLTMGFKKAKIKASIKGGTATLRTGPTAEFYFHDSASFNPNEFVLAKLESVESNRQVIVGQAGMLGASAGIRDDDMVAVTTSKIDDGIYKVVPVNELKPGEYGFISLANSNSQKLSDFGVDR